MVRKCGSIVCAACIIMAMGVKVKAEENDQFFSKILKDYYIPFLSDMVWLEMCLLFKSANI